MDKTKKTITLDIESHLHFIDSQLKRLEKDITESSSVSVKDLADYHRFAESMMFLAKAKKVIGD
ncbi:hypothetical protein [Enterococcus mundtii]|uniref:hypothetical protein n=1 Tax=Enterococcus mundtii TaxID=53346 RepID=UPI001A95C7E4|nr:hypothetical protein [Enterococcus mundtii]MBO1087258.1 hypothetical protein [Enterococcus mundtii]